MVVGGGDGVAVCRCDQGAKSRILVGWGDFLALSCRPAGQRHNGSGGTRKLPGNARLLPQVPRYGGLEAHALLKDMLRKYQIPVAFARGGGYK